MSFSDLPLISQIFDDDEITVSRPLPQTSTEKTDERLTNWEKWLAEREKTNQRLSSKLKRKPCDLLINYGDTAQPIKTDKKVIEYTNIAYPHDKYRGNPSFWETPLALHRRCPGDPDYFKVMTKDETNEIPDVEYYDVPTLTKKEKHTDCMGYRNAKEIWLSSSYRKLRVDQLQDKIELIEPFKPQMEELSIQGKGIKLRSWDYESPKSTTRDDFHIAYTAIGVQLYDIHANEEFMAFNGARWCPHSDTNVEVPMDFDFDIDTIGPDTKHVCIQNGTPLALRYYFTQMSKYKMFQDIANDNNKQVFFFDKRMNIILPQETINFPIWFKTDENSFYNTTLEFHITPSIFPMKVYIILSAVSHRVDVEDRIQDIKNYIDEKVKQSVVAETLDDILGMIPPPAPQQRRITLFTYDRSYIFESVNQKFTPEVRRPKYIYDKEVVDELEQFYEKVAFKGCPEVWDYNVNNLRKITRKRERIDRQKKALDGIYMIKLEDLQKRKIAGEDVNVELEALSKKQLFKDKTRPFAIDEETPFSERLDSIIKDLKDKLAKKEDNLEPLSVQLENIIEKLDTPSFCINNLCDTHQYVYAILCITFDRIVFDIEQMKNIIRIDTSVTYPEEINEVQPDPIRIEKLFLDEDLPKHPKLDQDFTQFGAPPPEALKDIPPEDVAARHLAYFGPPEVPDAGKGKKGKGKKGKKDKKDKKKKGKKEKGKKGKKGTSKGPTERPPTPQADLKEDKDFNPNPLEEYQEKSEIFIRKDQSLAEEEEESSSSASDYFTAQIDQYQFDLYKIFYKHLVRAVIRISDVIENSKKRKMKMPEFKHAWHEKLGRSKDVKIKFIDLKKAFKRAVGLKTHLPRPRTAAPAAASPSTQKKKKKPRTMKVSEPLKAKEQGSQWSLLKPIKKPEPSQKPISYPELCLLVRKRNIKKESVDVETTMSNCGIDPDWKDFQTVEVQTDGPPVDSPWEKVGVAAGIVEDIFDQAIKEGQLYDDADDDDDDDDDGDDAVSEDDYEDLDDHHSIREEESSDVETVFYDEDFSDVSDAVSNDQDDVELTNFC